MSSAEQNEGIEANPPQHLVEQLETMNRKWFRPDEFAYVELYNAKPHRPAGEWKFRIRRSGTKDILIEHLIPEKADGHTYVLMIKAMAVAADAARREAICKVALNTAWHMAETHGAKRHDFQLYIETGNVKTRLLP